VTQEIGGSAIDANRAYPNRKSRKNKYSSGSEISARIRCYAMDVDRERNCYSCRGFGHLV